MDNIEIKNAIITGAEITIDDHRFLTAWLHLDYGGIGQGFGGYALYLPKLFKYHTVNLGVAGHFIMRCMEIADVAKWDNIVGKAIRVKSIRNEVRAIGHITRDDWFEPERDFKEAQYWLREIRAKEGM